MTQREELSRDRQSLPPEDYIHKLVNRTRKTAVLAATLPPDPEDMNQRRSFAALRAVCFFALDFGEDYTSYDSNTRPLTFEQNASDLLADFAHLCDRQGWDFAHLLRRAERHYDEETDRKGKQFDTRPPHDSYTSAFQQSLREVIAVTEPYHQNDTAARPWLARAIDLLNDTYAQQRHVDAKRNALEAAHRHYSDYRDDGDPQADYGDDWPQVYRLTARDLRQIADYADEEGFLGIRFRDLAEKYEAQAASAEAEAAKEDEAAEICECGRKPEECATYDDPSAQHRDR